MLKQQIDKILNQFAFSNENLRPSEWIEKYRIIQPHVSERMAGKFDWSNTPYMKEIVNHLDPYSPVTHIAMMKGVRIGGTFALVHNGVPYIMKERPTNILLLSANDRLAEKTMKGVDFGIDGCNIRHLIGKANTSNNNAKGDTITSKHFSGGYELFNSGGQADRNLRQVTAGFIAADEIDAYKGVSKEAGSIIDLLEDRARSYGEVKKIVYISSPLLEETSIIYALYLQGDQRVFYVPCPKCGEYIEFVWNERNENNNRYGVIFDVKNNEVIKKSVRYRCGKCENEFFEKKHKREMLNEGYWKASIEREDKTFVSHRISALYAPVVMDNWYDFAKAYQKAYPRNGVIDDSKYQTFQNSILGWPYKKEGITIKSTALQKNRRQYKIGDYPYDLSIKDGNGKVMILSLSCDLGGWDSDPDHGDDARIDYEIMAHSENEVTYSIDAGSLGTFIPKTELRALKADGKDISKIQNDRIKYSYKLGVKNSVWDLLEEKIKITYGNNDRRLSIIAIDVGSFNEYAMAFVKKMRNMGYNCLAVMGAKEDMFASKSKNETAKIYQLSERGDVYLLNVNVIKDRLAKYIVTESYIDEDGQLHQPKHHMNFPEYDTKSGKYTYRNYFAHYESEAKKEKKTEGADTKYLWEKKRTGIQNHFWDVAVYNQFCQIFMTDLICSNHNQFKVNTYGTKPIKPTFENMCKLINEASQINNIGLD